MRGHIRKRGKSWQAIFYAGTDQSGKKRYIARSFPTRREAEDWLATSLVRARAGDPLTTAPRVQLRKVLEDWLEVSASKRCGPKTFEEYRRRVRLHILPALGHLPLSRLTPIVLEEYLARKLREGLSPSTVREHYWIIRSALSAAVRWGILARNPAVQVEPPRRRRDRPTVWDEEQVRLFLKEAKRNSPHYALYLTAVVTGMRQGELLALRWEDVNVKIGSVTVRRSMYRLGGRIVEKEPKSASSVRTVPLPPVCLKVLRKLREGQLRMRRLLGVCPDGIRCRKAACPRWHDTALVFCQPNGKPLHAHNVVRRDFRRVIERAGLPRIRFHDLRHVHASFLLSQGVNPRVVQERLGHSTAAFTLQTYAHVLPQGQREAVQAAEKLGGSTSISVAVGAGEPRGQGRGASSARTSGRSGSRS